MRPIRIKPVTKPEKNYQEIKALAFDLGFSLFGVADIREIRDKFRFSKETCLRFDSAVSLGKRLVDSVIEDINDHPTSLYFHHYRQVNFFLDRGAFLLASRIQEMGYQALPVPASQIINWEKQQAHLSHKEIGELAGLGWIGKNNLLINPKIGARFRLVTILTDCPLKKDNPINDDCGSCCACLSVCPAGAITENKESFNHLACFEKLKEFRQKGFVGQYICGICVKACRGKLS